MIDIHTHILYGLDDGPKTLLEAKNLLRLLHSQGIEMAIATPHLIPDKFPDVKKENVIMRIKELESILPIYEGYELHASYLPDRLKDYTLAGSKYILIEFSPFAPLSSIPKTIENIKRRGLIPIMAHTERYTLDIRILKSFKEKGALLQYNSDVVVKMGSLLYKLLKLDLIQFVASDIHPNRPLEMERAYKAIRRLNMGMAEKIFNINPYYIIKDQPMEGGIV